MPYIGNTPALDYISYAVQNFTVTAGTTVYTLDYSVSNENDIRLVLNNVIQRPGASYAYSATGTTLTLTSATQSGDTMYAVFIGRAVQTVVPPASSITNTMLAPSVITGQTAETSVAGGDSILIYDDSATALRKMTRTNFVSGLGGLTEADQWRLTANKTGNSDITANLERPDQSGFGYIGTGMTQSSGIFTFPSTGIYLITALGYWFRAGDAYSYAGIIVKFTIDNSTYTEQGRTYVSGFNSAGGAYGNSFINCLVDVTDVSNCKIKFTTDSESATLGGDTDTFRTGFTFIKLGDT